MAESAKFEEIQKAKEKEEDFDSLHQCSEVKIQIRTRNSHF